MISLIHVKAFSWNANGHALIAQIALDHLASDSKKLFSKLKIVEHAAWLDRVRGRDGLDGRIHYISIPESSDGTPLHNTMDTVHIIHALSERYALFSSQYAKHNIDMISLKTVVHLVGDLHQPLHTITRFSKEYPLGDRGGNLTLLPLNHVALSLHRYWDLGAGLLSKPMTKIEIKRYARQLEAQYPCSPEDEHFNVQNWAEASHDLAWRVAYDFNKHSVTLSKAYESRAKKIIESQMIHAGCRLAWMLNNTHHAI